MPPLDVGSVRRVRHCALNGNDDQRNAFNCRAQHYCPVQFALTGHPVIYRLYDPTTSQLTLENPIRTGQLNRSLQKQYGSERVCRDAPQKRAKSR
jgi:hypothetical protein